MRDEQADLVEEWVADFDDAVRNGVLPPLPPMGSEAQTENAGKAVHCLSLLEQVWPRESSRAGDQASEGTIKNGDSTSVSHRSNAPFSNAAQSPSAAQFSCVAQRQSWPERIGKFLIMELLGEGGFGIVFRAFDPDLDRDVAIKVPKLGSLLNVDQRSRFQREARLLARLIHPHLVPVFEAGETDNLAFIVSHLCSGPSLATWIHDQTHAVSCRQAAEMAIEIAEGLEHAHQNDILHRDLKPANVLLDGVSRGGKPWLRIADFGLARLNEEQIEATGSGMLIGTISYMAPEQAIGRADLDCRTDLYSLGVLLYELLIGQPPHRGETQMETLRLVQSREPIPPRRIRPEIPRDLETICLKCLAKDRSGRYASALEVRDDMQRFLDGEPIKAKPVRSINKLFKLARRFPFAATLIVGISLLLAALFVGSIWTAVVVGGKNGIIKREAKKALTAEMQAKQQLWESLKLQMSLAAQSSRIGSQSTAKNTLVNAIELIPDLKSVSGRHRLQSDAIQALSRSDFIDEPISLGIRLDPLLPRAIDSKASVTFGCSLSDVKSSDQTSSDENLKIYRIELDAPDQPTCVFATPHAPAMMATSTNGKRLAVLTHTADANSIVVWECSTGSPSRTICNVSLPECQWIAISRDGSRLAVAHNRSVQVIRVDNQQVVARFDFDDVVGPVALDDLAERVAVAIGNRVDIGRVTDSVIEHHLQHTYPAKVTSLAWNRSGDRLLVGRDDYNAYLWQLSCHDKPLQKLMGHQETITQTGFLGTDGMLLATGQARVSLWDPARGSKVLESGRESFAIFDSGFLFDDGEQTVKSQFVPSPIRQTFDSRLHNYEAYCIAHSTAGGLVAVGGYDSIRLWRLPSLVEEPGIDCTVAADLFFSSTLQNNRPTHLLARTRKGIQRFSLAQPSDRREEPPEEILVRCDDILGSTATLGSRGESVFWIGLDGKLRRWTNAGIERVSEKQFVNQPSDPFLNVAMFIDPHRQRVAIADNRSSTIQLVALDDGEIIGETQIDSSIKRVEFSPDESIFAVVSERGWSVQQIDPQRRSIDPLASESVSTTQLKFSADMQSILVAEDNGRVSWSSWPDLEPIAAFDCGSRSHAMVWTDQESRLFTTGEDLKLNAWNLSDMRKRLLP